MRFNLFHIIFLIFISLILLSSLGCQEDVQEPIYEIQIHLQGGFDNDIVELKFDGESVFKDKISTNNVLGIATVFVVGTNKGSHTLEVFTKEKEALFAFKVKTDLSIGINYDSDTQEITAIYSDEGFVYD